MGIAEWKEKLRQQLRGKEAESVEEVLNYYEEMISDRVENGEEEEAVLSSYGNSKELAASIAEELSAAAQPGELGSGYTEKTCNAVPGAISVSVFNNRVYLLPSPDGKVRMRYYETHLTKFEYNESENGVTLRSKRRNFFQYLAATVTLADIRNFKPVYLYVPESFCGELFLKSGNGSVFAENAGRAANVTIHADNGRVVCTGCAIAGNADVHSDNGRITLRNISAGSAISVHASNGRIEADQITGAALRVKSSNGALFLSRIECPDIQAKTSNGRIELGVTGRREDYRMELKTSNGAITVEGVKLMSQTLNENGKYSLSARSGNGRVTVNFLRDKSAQSTN